MDRTKFYALFTKGIKSLSVEDIGIMQFTAILVISLCAAFFVSYLYLTFYKNRATGSQIHRAFPLLGISVTAIFIGIQFSLPLSLGLLGALSIVRFRTPVKEPEEIGFIMLVIATSICCATFNIVFLAILLTVTYGGLVILKFFPRIIKGQAKHGMVLVTLPTDEYNNRAAAILDCLKNCFAKGNIESIIESEETVISYNFIQSGKETFVDLSPDMEKISKNIKTSFFFNQKNGI